MVSFIGWVINKSRLGGILRYYEFWLKFQRLTSSEDLYLHRRATYSVLISRLLVTEVVKLEL